MSLAKFAKAADPWSTGIAIYADHGGRLFIWGLVDQVLHLSTSVVRETEGTYPQPGAFHAVVNGPADITVLRNTHFIARLVQDALLTEQNDCFEEGPISEMITSWVEPILDAAYSEAAKEIDVERDSFWQVIAKSMWVRTVSRLLIHIQRERHGGALLITSYTDDALKIKHKMSYPRLKEGFQKALYYGLIQEDVAVRLEMLDFAEEEELSMGLYLDEAVSNNEGNDVAKMTTGAVRLVSSLAGIDGCVVISPDLAVSGFGAMIKSEYSKDDALLALSADMQGAESIKCDRYGMRHRSMLAYCNEHPGAVGFVVLQDGDVRVITCIDKRCVIFTNVKIHDLQLPKSEAQKKLSSFLATRPHGQIVQ